MEFLQSIPSPLIAIIGFIISISILVTIHEYGHFWVARKFGVKIEAFSVGFGKPIKKWKGKDGVDYIIGSLPLGGYVKMYGEDGSSANDRNSFAGKPAYQRFLIAFAGPAVNIIFTILIFWGFYLNGVDGIRPEIGKISTDSQFSIAGLEQYDSILNINGKPIQTVTDATIALVDNLGKPAVPISVRRNNQTRTFKVDLSGYPKGSEEAVDKAIGFNWEFQNQVNLLATNTLKLVAADSPASAAGLQANDTIITINDKSINNWQDISSFIEAHPNQSVAMEVLRGSETLLLDASLSQSKTNANIGFLGVAPQIDEKGLADFQNNFHTKEQYSFFTSLQKAGNEALYQAGFLLRMLKKMVIGEVSLKNMGGPVSIADYSGQAIQMGIEPFLRFLALMSITLAVINLLPIPALDGGHMLIYGVEMAMRRPLSERTIGILMRLGVSLLLTFMALVISMDVLKYLKLI